MLELFNKINKHFENSNNIIVRKDEDEISLLNKNNKREIKIRQDEYESADPSDGFIQYTMHFSYNHWHPNNINEIFELVQYIVNDEELVVQFFKDNKKSFGSGMSIEDYNRLSLDFLSEYYGYSDEYILERDIEVVSWSGKYDIPRKPTKELIK